MASPRHRRKRCRYCKALFSPDPRQDTAHGNRQYACSKPSCQKARHQDNRKDWLKRHPDAFQERYVNVKQWRSDHPEYTKQYRRMHPQGAQRDNEKRKSRHQQRKNLRAVIQDALLHQPSIEKAVKDSLVAEPRAVIQDPLWSQLLIISLVSSCYFARGHAVMQDAFASGSVPVYSPFHDPETNPHPRPYTPDPSFFQLGGPPADPKRSR